MSPFDSSASDPSDSNPISSGELETPRGGFMARPGMKAPPRHAVVVRQGDAPESEHIPVARSSLPPPPPESIRDKATVRAIPTPRPPEPETLLPPPAVVSAPPPSAALLALMPPRAVSLESAPPPSDAPVVANLAEELESPPRSRRRGGSWLAIIAAALAGLALGIVSVVTTVRVREVTSTESAPQTELPPVAAAARLAPTVTMSASAPPPSAHPAAPGMSPPEPAPEVGTGTAEPDERTDRAPARPAPPKRSIF